MHTRQNNTIFSSFNITYWKSDIFLLKYKALYVGGTTDRKAWTNSKTITNYTKELPEWIVKLMSVPKGEIVVLNFMEKMTDLEKII